MIKHIIFFTLLGMSLNQVAWPCSPKPKLSKPPRLINGEWVQPPQPSAKEITNTDFNQLRVKNYDFVFSGIYSQQSTFKSKALSFIKTKKIWQGKVTDTVNIDSNNIPTDNNCSKLKFDQEYVFFATLGSRNKPIRLKYFRKVTPELLSLLGKPSKQWLRGRLIQSR